MSRYEQLAKDMIADQFHPAEFSHQDHLGVAFELLNKLDFLEAAAIYGRAIRQYAEQLGAKDKFNTTITLAFLSIVAERQGAHTKFDQFIEDNPDLLESGLLSNWYSRETLNTPTARTIFVMPSMTA